MSALELLDVDDVEDVRLGLRSTFCAAPEDLPVFERCFWAWWNEEPERRPQPLDELLPQRADDADSATSPTTFAQHRPGADEGSEESLVGAAYSRAHSLAQRSFDSLDPRELREMDAWIERLIVRTSSRRSRRMERGGRRGPIDVRRTLRTAVAHDGELLKLARRRRRRVPPKLVVLCDVSGSMERYSRFLIRFLLGCGRAEDLRTFAFSTRLTYLTPWLGGRRVDEALAQLRARGWSSGTRIGECFETFLEHYGDRMLGQRTVVIILSDGLDQGEVAPLERAMRSLQRRARRVVWLNPLLESSRYAPKARGMSTALPYVDHFLSGHSLEALSDLPRLLKL